MHAANVDGSVEDGWNLQEPGHFSFVLKWHAVDGSILAARGRHLSVLLLDRAARKVAKNGHFEPTDWSNLCVSFQRRRLRNLFDETSN